MTARPAVFLDRDGTLTEPRHYPSRPSDLVLRPGIAAPLRALADRGVALVVVTNQSGLARGLFTEADLSAMHGHLRGLLGDLGITLDGIYHCPHHVDGVVPELSVACPCRKPEPGMLVRAAAELDLDLARSWMVGDFASDVGAGRAAGCRTALVGGTAPDCGADLRVPTTAEALARIEQAWQPCG